MLSNNVLKDLDIDSVSSHLDFTTPWGKDTFINKVKEPSTDIKELKKTQLPLLVFKLEPEVRGKVKAILKTLRTDYLDDLLHNKDPRIKETVEQVIWAPESIGSFLNSSPTVLNALITWKTLVLPLIAILMPIVALILPYVLLRLTSVKISSTEYLERMKDVLLQQITIPSLLKTRSDNDIIGFLLERLFIAVTLVTFISGIWNQISPALHLRNIWFTLEEQGVACIESIKGLREFKNIVNTLPNKKRVGLTSVLIKVDDILEHVAHLEDYGGVATYAHFYKDPTYLGKLVEFYAELDVYATIASLDTICFPTYTKSICCDLSGVLHPLVKPCISNNFNSVNALVTGPNRGGKSTYCKALGLAIMTAQSWGFAWAASFRLSPFARHCIALTPSPALGETSTFEAEIDFAKSVLSASDSEGPTFVMMDEIFHSTNAYDGVQASRIFLSQLYDRKNLVSLISTHYHELATEFEQRIVQLYLEAKESEDHKLSYTYKVSKGISKLSSVLEILEERGLFVPGPGAATAV